MVNCFFDWQATTRKQTEILDRIFKCNGLVVAKIIRVNCEEKLRRKILEICEKSVDNFFRWVYHHKHEGNGVFEVNTSKALFCFFLLNIKVAEAMTAQGIV